MYIIYVVLHFQLLQPVSLTPRWSTFDNKKAESFD